MGEPKCLKSDGACSVWLCTQGGRQVIVKEAGGDEYAPLFENEYRMLERIHASGAPAAKLFPEPVSLAREGNRVTLVRSYIPGVSLESLTESRPGRPGLPLERAAELTASVLEQLLFLHSLRPPVIQRDIKPQNVILGEDGQCHIIDMGISRVLDRSRLRDTHVIGTPMTAPPEQFGYRRTDERSDLYSAGVLLGYLLTGEYLPSERDLPPAARPVFRKATAFDPDKRYRTAEDMLRAVKRLTAPSKKRRIPVFAAAVLLAAAVLFALLPHPEGTYRFREELIARAVSLDLGIPADEITKKDLEAVTALHIFGKQVFTGDDGIWFLGQYPYIRNGVLREAGLWEENGGITSLEDLKAMPNLREIGLYNQQISDISPLRGMELAAVGLGYNPLTDLSPLTGAGSITSLNLTCLSSDPSEVLLSLTGLEEAYLGGVPIPSLLCLEEKPLRVLNLFDTGKNGILDAEAWESLARIPTLEKLTVGKLDRAVLPALAASSVTDLEVTHAGSLSVREMACMPRLKRLYFYSDSGETLSSEPLSFPALEWLDIKNTELESLECFSGLSSLSVLHIYACDCKDYRGLEGLHGLREIWCTPEQCTALALLCPGAAWEYR